MALILLSKIFEIKILALNNIYTIKLLKEL